MEHISVTWNCITLAVTEIFCWFKKQVENLKIVYKNIPRLCHCCYTQTPWVMIAVVL